MNRPRRPWWRLLSRLWERLTPTPTLLPTLLRDLYPPPLERLHLDLALWEQHTSRWLLSNTHPLRDSAWRFLRASRLLLLLLCALHQHPALTPEAPAAQHTLRAHVDALLPRHDLATLSLRGQLDELHASLLASTRALLGHIDALRDAMPRSRDALDAWIARLSQSRSTS